MDEQHLRHVAKEVNSSISTEWRELAHKNVRRKYMQNDPKRFGIFTKELIDELQSKSFCKWLEGVTSHRKVISDPYLDGGGLHAIARGGFLEIHADFNYSKRLESRRVINFLLYLNDPWEDAWGGNIELWDREMTRCEVSVTPRLGNVVIFSTDNTSYHGHPHPLECPAGTYRKSIALYYYSKGQPVEESHGTLYQNRGVE